MVGRRERTPVMSLYEWNLTLWAMSETRNRLDATGRGIYRELLDWCYAQGSIPADHVAMARHCGATLKQFDAVWPHIKSHFTTSRAKQNALENKVANVQRRQYFEFISRQKRSGESSARKRDRLKRVESETSATVVQPVLPDNSNQEDKRQEDKRQEEKTRDDKTREKEPVLPGSPPFLDADLQPLRNAIERHATCNETILGKIMHVCWKTAGITSAEEAAWVATWSISDSTRVRSAGLFLTAIPEFLGSTYAKYLRSFLDESTPIAGRISEARGVIADRKAPEKILWALRLWVGSVG